MLELSIANSFLYCIGTFAAFYFILHYYKLSVAASAWVLTLYNTMIVSFFALYLLFATFVNQIPLQELLVIGRLGNSIFLLNTFIDVVVGMVMYPSEFSRSGIIHHFVYIIFTYFFILTSESLNVFFCMFLMEEIPIVLLSLRYLKPEYFDMDVYCNTYIFFRVFYHLGLGFMVFQANLLYNEVFLFYISTQMDHQCGDVEEKH